MNLPEWIEESVRVGTQHTRALPPLSRRERLYRRIFGFYPQSVVDRRMEALTRDELAAKRWQRENPPPIPRRSP